MTDKSQQFASDNYSGICPEAWAAMEKANQGHDRAYGDDQWTERASEYFRNLFETDCEVFFAFNGTAANSLALASLCQSYHSVICSETAHVETDECGAPEFFSNGSKLLTAPSVNGKLTPESIREVALKRQDIHYPKPRVVTITQATEVGTVYRPDEL
ncbi:beta-eliminating lyase-related protein, partial [Pseudomonas sp.]